MKPNLISLKRHSIVEPLKQHVQSDEEKYQSFLQEIQDGTNFENPYSDNVSLTNFGHLKKKGHGTKKRQELATTLLETIEEKAS